MEQKYVEKPSNHSDMQDLRERMALLVEWKKNELISEKEFDKHKSIVLPIPIPIFEEVEDASQLPSEACEKAPGLFYL
jgi:hypothetical protein